MKGRISDRVVLALTMGTIFMGLIYFFYVAHPYYIFDSDDWTYVRATRHALPNINVWNPAKILPETLQPLISQIGVTFIYPVINDYIASLAFATALFMACCICIYTGVYFLIIRKLFDRSVREGCILSVIILLLHFCVFQNHRYLFYETTVNRLYNYTVPVLFNFICVALFASENIFSGKSYLKMGGQCFLSIYVFILIFMAV